MKIVTIVMKNNDVMNIKMEYASIEEIIPEIEEYYPGYWFFGTPGAVFNHLGREYQRLYALNRPEEMKALENALEVAGIYGDRRNGSEFKDDTLFHVISHGRVIYL